MFVASLAPASNHATGVWQFLRWLDCFWILGFAGDFVFRALSSSFQTSSPHPAMVKTES